MDDLVGRAAAVAPGGVGVTMLGAADLNLDPLFLGLALLIAVGGGLAVLGAWRTRGRDPDGLGAGILNAPPADLPPAVVGALLQDGVVGREAIVATLADLDRRGVLRIAPVGGGRSGRGPDFELRLVNDQAPLVPFERRLLGAVFGRELTQVRLSAVGDSVAAARPEVVWLVNDELVRRGYLETSPSSARAFSQAAGVVLMVVGVLVLWVASGTLDDVARAAWGMPAVALLALGVLSFGASQFMPWTTPAGAAAAAQWRGFARYLKTIARFERPHERRELFERYLPYAIVFGIARSWTQAFSPSGTDAGWYGPGGSESPAPSAGGGAEEGAPLEAGGGSWTMPDVQGWSDWAGASLQGASASLIDWFDAVGGAFDGGGGDGAGFGGDGAGDGGGGD